MQVDVKEFDTISKTVRVTYQNEGIRGFFKGSISNIYVGMGYYSM